MRHLNCQGNLFRNEEQIVESDIKIREQYVDIRNNIIILGNKILIKFGIKGLLVGTMLTCSDMSDNVMLSQREQKSVIFLVGITHFFGNNSVI